MKNDRIQSIQRLFQKCQNVKLIITGFIYPVPQSLVQNIDIFVCTAGSANTTYRFHRPTIRVHPVTGEPNGILGIDDVEGKSMYDTLTDCTIMDCIDKAIINKDKIHYRLNYYYDYFEKMGHEFQRQLAFADTVEQHEYYNTDLLMLIKPSHIKAYWLHWMIGHFINARGLNFFVKTMKRFFWKIHY